VTPPADAEDPTGEPDEAGEEAPVPGGRNAGGPTLDAADVALGLQYLTAFDARRRRRCPAGRAAGALEAASFAGALVVVLVPSDADPRLRP
jgi:hypothetical protein